MGGYQAEESISVQVFLCGKVSFFFLAGDHFFHFLRKVDLSTDMQKHQKKMNQTLS
jgi:hypothetical protein